MIDNLSGRQLNALAEVVFANQEQIGRSYEISEEDKKEEEDCPQKQQTEGAPQQKCKWTQQDIRAIWPFFPEHYFSKYRDFLPVKIFELFFGDEIFHIILSEIWNYALFNNSPNPEVSKEELKLFLGVLIVSGYNELPGRRFYWDSEMDMRNRMVYNAIRRDSFIQIMKYLHFAFCPHCKKNMKKIGESSLSSRKNDR
jgi:hypothetical protein